MGESGHDKGLSQDTLLVTILETSQTVIVSKVPMMLVVSDVTYDAKKAINITLGFSRIDCQIVLLGVDSMV